MLRQTCLTASRQFERGKLSAALNNSNTLKMDYVENRMAQGLSPRIPSHKPSLTASRSRKTKTQTRSVCPPPSLPHSPKLTSWQTNNSHTNKLNPHLPPRLYSLPLPAPLSKDCPACTASPHCIQDLYTTHPPALQRHKQHARVSLCPRSSLRCYIRTQLLWARRTV